MGAPSTRCSSVLSFPILAELWLPEKMSFRRAVKLARGIDCSSQATRLGPEQIALAASCGFLPSLSTPSQESRFCLPETNWSSHRRRAVFRALLQATREPIQSHQIYDSNSSCPRSLGSPSGCHPLCVNVRRSINLTTLPPHSPGLENCASAVVDRRRLHGKIRFGGRSTRRHGRGVFLYRSENAAGKTCRLRSRPRHRRSPSALLLRTARQPSLRHGHVPRLCPTSTGRAGRGTTLATEHCFGKALQPISVSSLDSHGFFRPIWTLRNPFQP